VSASGAVKIKANKPNGDVESQAVVSVEQLLMELQSLAVEWKSLRRATNCSCAIPFEQHSKKVFMPEPVCRELQFYICHSLKLIFLCNIAIYGLNRIASGRQRISIAFNSLFG